jgi:protein O-GlcNAc transferase
VAHLVRNGCAQSKEEALMTVQLLFDAGCQALAAARFEEAVRLFREALAENDQVSELWNNLGIALFSAGKRGEALQSFERAVLLAPDFAQAHNNFGRSLAGCGELEQGLAACRQALALEPLYAEAHNNLGVILMRLDRHREALESFTRACQLDPGLASFWNDRASANRELGRLDAAAAGYRKALQVAPGHAPSLVGLSSVHQQRGEIDRAISLLQEAVALAPDNSRIHTNLIMSMNYSHLTSQQELADESALWGCLHGEQFPAAPLGKKDFLGRRVRVGYVSADLYQHPVGTFLKEVLKNHDRTAFEITCYQNGTRSDQLTSELKRHADRWFVIAGLSDAEAFELIKSNGIDILVDLSGHTGGNRLTLFSRRPAPIQATWLGYWHSTGLSSIDYLITDAVTVPPGEDRYFSERLLRLPRCRFCYAPPSPSPFVDELPAKTNGFVTFGSFNNIAKLTPPVIALWAQLLLAVPGSRLVLKWKSLGRAAVRNSFLARFAAHGVAPERIECRGSSSHFLALAEYNDIDIALDPFPFNGGLTSCEALWMGVPVLTLTGDSPIARQSASLLEALALPELICHDEEEYLATAARLAGEPQRLALLREGLRDRMAASQLCDGPGFSRDLEEAYRVMLREKSAGSEAAGALEPGAQKGAGLPGAPESARPAPPPAAHRWPVEPAPRSRLRVAYLVPRQGVLGAAAAVLDQAALHDPEEMELFLYLDQDAGAPAPSDAAVPAMRRRSVGRLSDLLVSRLLLRDRIDLLVDLGAAELPSTRGPLLGASVPVRLGMGEIAAAALGRAAACAALPGACEAELLAGAARDLDSLYRERWLDWFVAQRKPRKGRAPAESREQVEEARGLQIAGRLEEAGQKLALVLRGDPRNADALTVLGAVLVYQWRLAEGLACFRRALAFEPGHVKARSSLLFALNYSDRAGNEEFYRQGRAWDKAQSLPPLSRAPFPNPARPERPLRIGYLSADLYRHSVSFFFEPLLKNHDSERFETVCYSCVARPDATTSRLQALASSWRQCAELDDAQIARLVREDQIDILVDLAGHSGARIRLPVLAQKPAPIQVSWLGYPNTTGLRAIDYRLTDAEADPEGEADGWHSERLWRLPGGFLCYLPPGDAPEPGPAPLLTNGYVTFGSFNMLPKLSSATVALWARLLREVAGSRLVLKCHPLGDPRTRERVLRGFSRFGIDPARIRLVPVLAADEHLALYNEVDIALDPFPYNGTTTSCEALWMGVPVVTLAGERHAGRVGNSLLRRLCLDELIARDPAHYLAIAVGLCGDPERLSRYRSGLRGLMAGSPLCDGERFAREVEGAYREMWRSWCRAAGKKSVKQGGEN